MKTFKTKKGTEIPLLDLRGKDYLQVPWRILWMREEHPDWTIETFPDIRESDKSCVTKAFIKDQTGRILSTAHKYEDAKGFPDYIEKSETGAIGRALGFCGYGTQFAPELSEEDRLADAPLEKKGKPMSLVNPPSQRPKVKEYSPPTYGDPSNEPSPFDEEDSIPAPKIVNTLTPRQDKEMPIGKHTGKQFSEILSLHMDYVTYMRDQIKQGKNKSQAMTELVNYAESHGAFSK